MARKKAATALNCGPRSSTITREESVISPGETTLENSSLMTCRPMRYHRCLQNLRGVKRKEGLDRPQSYTTDGGLQVEKRGLDIKT
jgi:hypothetical protein